MLAQPDGEASCPFETSELLTEVGFNRINQLLAVFQRPRN